MNAKPAVMAGNSFWASMTAPAPDLSKLRIDRDVAPIRRRRRRKWIWLAHSSRRSSRLPAAGIVLQPRAQTVQTTPIVTDVSVAAVRRANATGYVVAQRKAAISSKATGRLEWLGVAEGSRVKAGDVIARIDDRDVVAQAQSAEASVRAARANVAAGARSSSRTRRSSTGATQDLVEKNFVSRVRARHREGARAIARRPAWPARRRPQRGRWRTRATPQVAVDYTLIRAPFDGVILSKSANVGDLVTPFSNAADSKGAVVTMADMSTLEVEADVSESSLAKVQRRPAGGDPARCAARHALSRPHQPHGADRRPREGDGDDQGQVRRDRPAHPAGDERQGGFLSQEVTPEQQKPLARGAIPTRSSQRDGRSVRVRRARRPVRSRCR